MDDLKFIISIKCFKITALKSITQSAFTIILMTNELNKELETALHHHALPLLFTLMGVVALIRFLNVK